MGAGCEVVLASWQCAPTVWSADGSYSAFYRLFLLRLWLPATTLKARCGVVMQGTAHHLSTEVVHMAGGTATRTEMDVWELDPAHSSVEFSVKHMMMTTVRGRFKDLQATLTGNEDNPEGCCVEVTISTASIDTGSPDRDTHLKSADFFDSEQHPSITFTSTRLDGDPRAAEGARFRVFGDLTIRDTTMPIALDCMFEGRGNDPWGKERAGFSCYTEIDRRDWGLKWNQAIETGGVLVANKVRIEAEVQFVRRAS